MIFHVWGRHTLIYVGRRITDIYLLKKRKLVASKQNIGKSSPAETPPTTIHAKNMFPVNVLALCCACKTFGVLDWQAEVMIQNDGKPGRPCTCLIFMKPTEKAKMLLVLWTQEITDTNAKEDQVSSNQMPAHVCFSNASGHRRV